MSQDWWQGALSGGLSMTFVWGAVIVVFRSARDTYRHHHHVIQVDLDRLLGPNTPMDGGRFTGDGSDTDDR